jgi:hypothetical protein
MLNAASGEATVPNMSKAPARVNETIRSGIYLLIGPVHLGRQPVWWEAVLSPSRRRGRMGEWE